MTLFKCDADKGLQQDEGQPVLRFEPDEVDMMPATKSSRIMKARRRVSAKFVPVEIQRASSRREERSAMRREHECEDYDSACQFQAGDRQNADDHRGAVRGGRML
jgi:hypothetical protein